MHTASVTVYVLLVAWNQEVDVVWKKKVLFKIAQTSFYMHVDTTYLKQIVFSMNKI